MSWRALRLAREEPDQVLRLQAFRAAHPLVIIGDAGFGVWQARVPEPDGEHVIRRYTLRELLDKLDELTGEHRSQSDIGHDRNNRCPSLLKPLPSRTAANCPLSWRGVGGEVGYVSAAARRSCACEDK